MEKTPLRIGKYLIIKKLTEGSIGALYQAVHPTLDRPVIIKKLMTTDRPTVKERFRREARIMMDLRCEQIVQVFDHFRDGSAYYIVMQYVKGTDLHRLLLQRRYLPNEIALLIFCEVARALRYAHEHNIIHRDIKPANILIADTGEVRLTDFGVAAARHFDEELTQVGMTLGTPAYMAPEQMTSPEKVDQKADIYSLGVVLYVMVTGQKPFQGGSTTEIIAAVTRGHYRPPRKVNPDVLPLIQKIIKKCIHPKAAKRYKDLSRVLDKCAKLLKPYKDKEMARDTIRQYLSGEMPAPEIGKDTAPPLLMRWSKTRKVVAVTTLLLALGFSVGLWGLRQGWHYELLHADEYGSLLVEATLRKTDVPPGQPPIRCELSLLKDKVEKQVSGVDFTFHRVNAGMAENLMVFRSTKQYLPAGMYAVRVNAGNEQHKEQFYLPPLSVLRQQVLSRDGHRLKIAMAPNPPGLPLKLKYLVKNQVDQKNITADTDIFINYGGRWYAWDRFIRMEKRFAGFVSGKSYKFRFKKELFYPRDLYVDVDWHQTVLNLEVNMIPHPGYLIIDSKIPGLTASLNHLNTFFEGGKKPAYKPLEPMLLDGKKKMVPAGGYFLTVKEDKTWWQRLSLFPLEFMPPRSYTRQIRIEPWRPLKVTVADDENGKRLMLKVKP